MNISKSIFLGVFALFFAFCAMSETPSAPPLKGGFQAYVQYVDDGDTIDVLVSGVRHRIRLSDIDAPEVSHCNEGKIDCKRPGQPFSKESKARLTGLVAGGRVELLCRDYDSRYSRSVCRVYANGVDANLTLVREGLAWFNEKYSRDGDVRRAQDQAKRSGLGIWSDRNAVAPWAWRDSCWKWGNCR